jgi:hypothetical protein
MNLEEKIVGTEKYLYTRNVKFAAYLRLKGHHPDDIKKMSRGKAMYGYEKLQLPQELWDRLKAQFDKSEFITFAQCLDAIIDLAF